MKVIRLNFGVVEISLRLHGWWRTKEMQIRKYEIMPRNFLPEIKRSLARQLKSKAVRSAEDVNVEDLHPSAPKTLQTTVLVPGLHCIVVFHNGTVFGWRHWCAPGCV